jgi:serine protease
VTAYRFAIGDKSLWTELSADETSFRPDDALAGGQSHSFYLQASYGLTWSASAEVSVYVAPFSWEAHTPDDPLYPQSLPAGLEDQWSLSQIRMPELWGAIRAIGDAGEPVRVAVVDSGIVPHPDLGANVKPEFGYDFVFEATDAGDGNGYDPDPTDEGDNTDYHGTSVASIIGATTDNAVGMSGIGMDRLVVVPLRALGKNADGSTFDIAQAIRYAAGLPNQSGTALSPPAKIINLSLGGVGITDSFLEASIQMATDAGSVVVAATGNQYMSTVGYPASSPYTVAVGATVGTSANDLRRADYSNYGDDNLVRVDVVAPGGDRNGAGILVADPEGIDPGVGYGFQVGTSFATPHVSGVLGLLCVADPELDLVRVLQVLAASSEDLGASGRDREYGYGFLDAIAAFNAATMVATRGLLPVPSFQERLDASAEPTAPPSPEVIDGDTLIVRWKEPTGSRSLEARPIRGISRVLMDGNGDTLVKVAEGSVPAVVRSRILEDERVEDVFYNYRYSAF